MFIFTINQDQSLNKNTEETELIEPKNPQLSAQETLTTIWLENPTFEDPIEPTWYSELEGDLSDVEATAGLGNLNLKIRGDSGIMRIDEPLSDSNWYATNNPEFPILPDNYGIDSTGCFVSHSWDEYDDQTLNTPSIHWKRNITLPVDMSDYIITSASLEVLFNATVTVSPHQNGIDTKRDFDLGYVPQFAIGDFATFYVLIADLENENEYRIAVNKTTNLGQDNPAVGSYPDTLLQAIPQDILISYLTSVIEKDKFNFTIILGIDIYCEDNEPGGDIDIWDSLLIKSFNLTFTYEKKIDQFTTVSWNQDGGIVSNISSDIVIIDEARLNFKYKIDSNWTEASPNSEIRAFINNNKLSETIKLSEAPTSFKDAKAGGYDVTSLIPYDVNINFSIQIYLADEFNLDKNVTISFDYIYLNITYTVIFPDFQTNLEVFFNGVNKTSNPIYDHPVGNDLNITVKYPDDKGNHISGAIVQLSGNLTGTLIENETLEQYTTIIDANDLNVGILYFKIVAHKINFELSTINPIVTVIPTETQDLDLFLNGEDLTLDPSIDIPLDSVLNITVKYNTELGTPIKGATVILSGEGVLEILNESASLNQYSILINSSIKLRSGINNLKIDANKLNFQEQSINPRFTVRKINSVITPVNNTNTISIRPGEDANIQVYINNTDFNEIIKGAIVTYIWEQGIGILEDLDEDGIYEVNLTDIPIGTHQIIIKAVGSDKYNFISLEMFVVVIRPAAASPLFLILLIIGIIVSIGLGSYLYAYQKVLKYPKTVRKVRKYRRTLRKSHAPSIVIVEQKKSFKSAYEQELSKTSKFMKGKQTEEKIPKGKFVKETPEYSKAELINEPKNRNMNSYYIDKTKNINKKKYGIPRKIFNIKPGKSWHNLVKLRKNKKFFYLVLILSTLILYTLIIIPFFNQNSCGFSENSVNYILNENFDKIGISAQESLTKQWLDNPNFTSPLNDTWYPSYGEFGDNLDVIATNGPNYVNYTIIGDSGKISIDNVLNETDWIAYRNPDLPVLPDTYEINSAGCEVFHLWDESVNQTRNRPSVNWKRTINMPIDMRDYIITSASLEVIFNATVTVSPHSGGGIDRLGDDGGIDFYSTGDYAKFYALIADVDETFDPIQIASNNTAGGNLGQDGPPSIGSFPDSEMDKVPQDVLIDVLTLALATNGFNFTITLGIDIYCEDNEYGVDEDRWDSLIIRSFNLTFSYEKKIDQFTTVSWNQDADKISDLSNDTVIVNKALLNFKYKIDKDWVNSSPNSEIRVLINKNNHPETVKLSTATTSYQEVKIGGFDITPLIIDDVNLSIQVYLADEFGLDRNITISIKEAYLNISYTIIFPDKETNLYLFLNSVNKTNDPEIDIFIGDSLNITVKYLNKTGAYIPNATVQLSGNFTGDLDKDELLEQHTIIIDTDVSDAGINFLTITAQAEDHETRVINVIVRINKFTTKDLQIILNNQNVTHDPYIELTVSKELNVTVKYNQFIGTHITGANVLLASETFTSYLNESVTFEQYSILIDTNTSLKIGTNYLTINAQAETYQTEEVEIIVKINKIKIEIEPLSGSNTIESRTGEDIRLKIRLNNTYKDEFIIGALITYTWDQGTGVLEDLDEDGIYEATIANIPEGTYPIDISAFVGDDYFVEDYEIIIIASSEEAHENIIFPILFIISIILITSLAIYLYAYQAYLKYPKQVRKVRKYRKSLKRKSAPSVHVIGRESAFRSHYNDNLGKSTSNLKLKHHAGSVIP
ncbi:MAG: hypothetical protein ACFFG0_23100, partial [Candidatus Thorarchaeota archaeon]